MSKPTNPAKLINDYFKMDILSMDEVPKSVKKLIEETFNYAAKQNQTLEQITEQLEGTELSKTRERFIKIADSYKKPFPLRLKELKPILQAEAWDNERSLHSLIRHILKKYVEGKRIAFF